MLGRSLFDLTGVGDFSTLDLKQRVDEGRHRGPLRQHNQGAKQKQNDENRQQPELFPFFHKGPQFHQKAAHTSSVWGSPKTGCACGDEAERIG